MEIGAIDKYTGRTADRMRTRNYYVLHMAAQRCNNCLRYALQWRAQVLAAIHQPKPRSPYQLAA